MKILVPLMKGGQRLTQVIVDTTYDDVAPGADIEVSIDDQVSMVPVHAFDGEFDLIAAPLLPGWGKSKFKAIDFSDIGNIKIIFNPGRGMGVWD